MLEPCPSPHAAGVLNNRHGRCVVLAPPPPPDPPPACAVTASCLLDGEVILGPTPCNISFDRAGTRRADVTLLPCSLDDQGTKQRWHVHMVVDALQFLVTCHDTDLHESICDLHCAVLGLECLLVGPQPRGLECLLVGPQPRGLLRRRDQPPGGARCSGPPTHSPPRPCMGHIVSAHLRQFARSLRRSSHIATLYIVLVLHEPQRSSLAEPARLGRRGGWEGRRAMPPSSASSLGPRLIQRFLYCHMATALLQA